MSDTASSHRPRWHALLFAAAWLGCAVQAQAQCGGQPNSQQYTNCMMNTVILPEQQRQQREAAERQNQPPPPRTVGDQLREEAAWVSRHGWGAYAASPGLAQVGAASDLTSEAKAERQARKDCERQGGRDCKVIATVNNRCLALAHNGGGAYALAAKHLESEAAGQALAECNAKSPGQVCRLHSPLLCPGQGVSARPAERSAEDYARELEVHSDKRPFFGAVASDGSAVYLVANATSAQDAGQRALADCGGGACKLLAATALEDQCQVAAWAPGQKGEAVVVESAWPVDARLNALRKCSALYGQACAASAPSCSGRAHLGRQGDGVVHAKRSMQAGDDAREALAPWVGGRVFDAFYDGWGSPSRIEDGGDLLAKSRELIFDYGIDAGRGRPARPCRVIWSSQDDNVSAYRTEGEGCAWLVR